MASSHKGFPLPLDTAPMEAKSVDRLPDEPGWQYEPKWDGFRCLAFKSGDMVELRAKSGKSLSRYFPDVVIALKKIAVDRFVVDGELTIPIGDTLSFDALQMRLHPAESRVRKLATESPALLILFDCLADSDGNSLMAAPLSRRRAVLEDFMAEVGDAKVLRLTPYTRSAEEARRWLDRVGGALDGVVAKKLDGHYSAGERDMLKMKRLRTADCVVGGFRYEADSKLVGSLLLGLYDGEGKLDHVGFTSGISDAERPALTRELEKLIEAPGFSGNAPGGPSRWSTERSSEWQPLRNELVVEVRYDLNGLIPSKTKAMLAMRRPEPRRPSKPVGCRSRKKQRSITRPTAFYKNKATASSLAAPNGKSGLVRNAIVTARVRSSSNLRGTDNL